MQFIHASLGKSKKRKPNAKQRELQADWEALIRKYEPKKPLVASKIIEVKSSDDSVYRRKTPRIPSLPFTAAPCLKKENPVYTGTKMKGIGVMHKSNAVPIFSNEEAVEIARMRRG